MLIKTQKLKKKLSFSSLLNFTFVQNTHLVNLFNNCLIIVLLNQSNFDTFFILLIAVEKKKLL